jgi:hypothetical protein
MGLKVTGSERMEWIHLAQNMDQRQAVMELWVPQKAENFFIS